MYNLDKSKIDMEEILEQVLEVCCDDEAGLLTFQSACQRVGLNYEKILSYSSTDSDAKNMLKVCCWSIRARIMEKYYFGLLSKCEGDMLMEELSEIFEIYLNAPTDNGEKNA